MIGLIKGYFRARKYNEIYRQSVDKALLVLDDAKQAVIFADIKKEESFVIYGKLLDCSEEALRECKRLVGVAKKDDGIYDFIKIDAIKIAKLYQAASKIYAFAALALSAIGEFQPLRAKEVISEEVEYPTFNNLPTR